LGIAERSKWTTRCSKWSLSRTPLAALVYLMSRMLRKEKKPSAETGDSRLISAEGFF
jgi:hypothetical protein